MENEVNVVNIDGIDYIVLDEIFIDNTKYVYLVNENDEEDFFINKIIIKEGKEYLTGLNTEEEAKKAMQAYADKNADCE